ncbi:hypothetical protein [Gymnodinialimonas ceratoperidinii]|uniref:Uncharacterized protein n=1 Tax=Gymnodinialimonas ceratoperidinii TaxID=2856823 RepID=A0A8F6TWT4_9RHOB|nr:hypothetical protein [Gymnodinialimonas ceratoperidinii]QXT39378.1 hypothetical protein KYE46_15845 [Gymnodinialimonas ceratoperidinii]
MCGLVFALTSDTILRMIERPRVLDLMGDPGNPVSQGGLVDREAYLKLFTAFCDHDARVRFKGVFAPFSLSLWLADWQARAASPPPSAPGAQLTSGTYAYA